VVLKLEVPRVIGKLSQFYCPCEENGKYLILYTLLTLKHVEGKTLIFVKTLEHAYKVKIFFERVGIIAMVMHSGFPPMSQQHILDGFNQNTLDLLIAAEEGEENGNMGNTSGRRCEEPTRKREWKGTLAEGKSVKKPKGEEAQVKDAVEEENPKPEDTVEDEVNTKKRKKKKNNTEGESRKQNTRIQDNMFSLIRGVDMHAVQNVINVDVPTTVQGYVHRVCVCARAGTKCMLTLCTPNEEECMGRIIESQTVESALSTLQKLPMQMADVKRFKNRVEDAYAESGLTSKVVWNYRYLELEKLGGEELNACDLPWSKFLR